jgi:hypothetical protein
MACDDAMKRCVSGCQNRFSLALALALARLTHKVLATDTQKAINSICVIVFPPQLPTTLSSPVPDTTIDDENGVKWQRFT